MKRRFGRGPDASRGRRDSSALAEILERVLPPSDRYLVKVTWHGYAPGTYTGPLALDLLLGALPGRAVVIEGHTSSRNLGGRGHRLGDRRRAAPHLDPAAGGRIPAAYGIGRGDRPAPGPIPERDRGVVGRRLRASRGRPGRGSATSRLRNPELAGFFPSALLELRGCPLISFARFKGPTRLGLSNLFGLIPHPLRSEWHGPDITHFASVCCDVARLYECFFPLYGLVEAFDSALRWDRKGLYRSRWGNYDLLLTDGLFTMSEGLVGADLLASRLQGQDVLRSGFSDVVRGRLDWSGPEMLLPPDLQSILV